MWSHVENRFTFILSTFFFSLEFLSELETGNAESRFFSALFLGFAVKVRHPGVSVFSWLIIPSWKALIDAAWRTEKVGEEWRKEERNGGGAAFQIKGQGEI